MAPIHYPNGNDATLRVGKLAGPRSRGVMRAAFGAAVPDFTTALAAYAMWGLTPAYQSEAQQLGVANGSLDTVGFLTKADPPFYCNIRQVIDDAGDTLIVNQFNDQTGNTRDLIPGTSPAFRYTGGDPLNGISILNAGTAGVNIDYQYSGMMNDKPGFTPDGTGDPRVSGICWSTNFGQWLIFLSSVVQYAGTGDVATPDLASEWTPGGGAGPIPIVFPTELLYAEVDFRA